MFSTIKFGGNICRLRKSADMTQSELADKIGVTRADISRYELGDSFPDVSILVLLAQTFGITTEELINAGEPSPGELKILNGIANGDEVRANAIDDIEESRRF